MLNLGLILRIVKNYLWIFGSYIWTSLKWNFLAIISCKSPPKPHAFIKIKLVAGFVIGEEDDSDDDENDGDDEENSDSSSDEEEEDKLTKAKYEYQHNEEHIIYNCRNMINRIKEVTGNKKIQDIVEEAEKEESELDKKVEDFEKSGKNINYSFDTFSDTACGIWTKALTKAKSLHGYIPGLLDDEEELADNLSKREKLKGEIVMDQDMARFVEELTLKSSSTSPENKKDTEELSKSAGKRPLQEEKEESSQESKSAGKRPLLVDEPSGDDSSSGTITPTGPSKKPRIKDDGSDDEPGSGSSTPTGPGPSDPGPSGTYGSGSGSGSFRTYFSYYLISLITVITDMIDYIITHI